MSMVQSAVEIAPGVHWVGKRDPDSIFHANPYLRIFEGTQGDQALWFTLLVDPGSPSDCATVAAKLSEVVGSANRLSAMFLNHQDPDVASSAPFFSQRFAPRAHILCSEDTWRLVVHYGLDATRFHATDRHLRRGLTLPTGHVLQFVPTPYCHFRGATMLYDRESGVLFSGDLLGGLSPRGEESLWADESAWPGMRAFHQIYMPSREAIQRAVTAIRSLDPFPTIIAPQHGGLLAGDWIEHYLRRLEMLPVGVELLDDVDDDILGWSHVLRKIIATAQATLPEPIEALLAADELLADTTRREKDRLLVVRQGRSTVERVLHALGDVLDPQSMNLVLLEALAASEVLQLPTPRIDLEGFRSGVRQEIELAVL
jgi:eukaryotic-like serine/threonine-protein kinase